MYSEILNLEPWFSKTKEIVQLLREQFLSSKYFMNLACFILTTLYNPCFHSQVPFCWNMMLQCPTFCTKPTAFTDTFSTVLHPFTVHNAHFNALMLHMNVVTWCTDRSEPFSGTSVVQICYRIHCLLLAARFLKDFNFTNFIQVSRPWIAQF